MFDTQIDVRNGVARVAVTGELDISTVPALEQHLGSYQADGVGAIVLDLRDLSFVDSSGLHAFLRARHVAEENGHKLLLVGAPPSARRVFELTELDFLLDEPEAFTLLDRFSGNGFSGNGFSGNGSRDPEDEADEAQRA
jgi:anti-anti-sigma factor